MSTLHNSKVLVIGKVWPESKSSAAGKRMLDLLSMLTDKEWEVHFATSAAKTENSNELTITSHQIRLNDNGFDTWIQKLNPQIVVFDRFMTEEQFGWRVQKHCPDALRVIDTEDLHGLRAARKMAIKQGTQDETSFYHNDVMLREIASILRSDLSLIISTVEYELLTDYFKVPSKQLCYMPLFAECLNSEELANLPQYDERQDFYSIGNFLHEPNLDAVVQLKEKFWTLIRKELPKAKLNVYGAYTPDRIHQFHNEDVGFIVHGRVEDVPHAVKNARVCLAPLRFGAGQKGKLLEAMVFGTPNVCSNIAAESMQASLDWSGFVSDEPNAFAQKAIELYQSEKLWKEKQENGFKIVRQLFNKNDYQSNFLNTIIGLLSNLRAHRDSNPLQAVMNHHSLKSAEYLSKWIMEKNK